MLIIDSSSQCDACYERFTSDDLDIHCPHYAPCGHIACLVCFRRTGLFADEESLKCPLCMIRVNQSDIRKLHVEVAPLPPPKAEFKAPAPANVRNPDRRRSKSASNVKQPPSSLTVEAMGFETRIARLLNDLMSRTPRDSELRELLTLERDVEKWLEGERNKNREAQFPVLSILLRNLREYHTTNAMRITLEDQVQLIEKQHEETIEYWTDLYNGKQRECQKYRDECQILTQRIKRLNGKPLERAPGVTSTSGPSLPSTPRIGYISTRTSLRPPSPTLSSTSTFVTATTKTPRAVSTTSDPGPDNRTSINTNTTTTFPRSPSGSIAGEKAIPPNRRWSTRRPLSAYDNPPTVYSFSADGMSVRNDQPQTRGDTRVAPVSGADLKYEDDAATVIQYPPSPRSALRRYKGPSSLTVMVDETE